MEHQVSDILINTWAAMVTLILFMYVALDGFDLGVGVLSLLEQDSYKKSLMMRSLGGVWDANETWLVLLGGTLFGAFPLAYAAALQALYFPVMLMLFALIFRGVAFEFCLYAKTSAVWVFAFGIGSLLAIVAQGLALSCLLSGIVAQSLVLSGLLSGLWLNNITGTTPIFNWVTPFSLVTVALLITTYSLLGATYLFAKVDGTLRQSAAVWASRSTILLAALLVIFFLFGPINTPFVTERWSQHLFYFGILLFIMAVMLLLLLWSLKQKHYSSPFILCLVTLFIILVGLVSSNYPYIVPGVMTLHAAASSTKTLEFMLYAEGGLLPLMLIYNGYQYYVLRGQVTENH
ncbi:MAG: cytochrome d ubiquinol oxidase subunit II [Methylococcaceae bacterium]